MTTEELLAKAKLAKPTHTARGKWAEIYCVYDQLRTNGFNIDDALNWLIAEGKVAEADKDQARCAFKALAYRRNLRARGK